MGAIDEYININLNTKGTDKVAKDLAVVKKSIASITKQELGQLKTNADSIVNRQKFQQQYWNSYFKNNERAIKLTDDFSGRTKSSFQRSNEIIKKNSKMFEGYALSIMFAGMALQRLFSQVWSFGTKTFQEISHSVEGSATGFDLLEGSIKFLGFSIGAALEPITAWLVPIVDKIADWVSQNEATVRTITVIGVVLGGLLTTFGMVKLAITGITTAWGIFKATFITGNLASSFALFAGKISAVWAGTIAFLKGLSLAQAIGLGSIILGIITLIIWIFKLKDAIGGWGEFFKSVIRGILRVIVLLGEYIVTVLITPMQVIVALAVRAMDFLGIGTPKWMEDFAKWKPNFKEAYFDWEEEKLAPKNGYMQYGGLLPTTSQVININNLNVESTNVQELLREIERVSG